MGNDGNGSRRSRFPGFYKLPVDERRERLASSIGLPEGELRSVLDCGGLDVATADKTIENVLGIFALPFAVGLNFVVNGRDHLVPMAVEEPSVVAAASNAARMVRDGGGFFADADEPVMIAQIEVHQVPDAEAARAAIIDDRAELLRRADDAVPGLVARGGGARGVEVRDLGDGMIVVHLLVDCRDAMGANLVNTVAESVADRICELSHGDVGLRILSNLCDRRRVRVRVAVPPASLAGDGSDGEAVRDGIVWASRFAEKDPYRAATHNKGIMNGVDAVVLATGNDWRAAEAAAHAFAARDGHYRPLSTWRTGAAGELVGQIEMPLALGIVGGPSRVHGGVRLALRTVGVETAQELAMVVASVGLASNLAALRALATEGIQRGHMSLHARSVAVAAGARGDDVERVSAALCAQNEITVEAARRLLGPTRT
ncbi:MAG: hydroxymethylglutaryl-CoA reductase, degradative [Deltaproteobacteria bacterium]|nr:hydroxymethylglutaryl-CoA reductase, degradative [Deltaproteobacteria bacterium]